MHYCVQSTPEGQKVRAGSAARPTSQPRNSTNASEVHVKRFCGLSRSRAYEPRGGTGVSTVLCSGPVYNICHIDPPVQGCKGNQLGNPGSPYPSCPPLPFAAITLLSPIGGAIPFKGNESACVQGKAMRLSAFARQYSTSKADAAPQLAQTARSLLSGAAALPRFTMYALRCEENDGVNVNRTHGGQRLVLKPIQPLRHCGSS
jgi:hypothetical protein